MIQIINGDCLNELPKIIKTYQQSRNMIIVSDPPFNVKYHYRSYKDNMDEDAYYDFLSSVFNTLPFVIIHYPENIYKLASRIGKVPDKVISWVYNSNTAKQHRDIAFFDVKPDLNKVKQPYKNPNDKRIQKRISEGKTGCRLYDWWNVNQVKNVSTDKVDHPCQMPLEVMSNIIGILPEDTIIVDPFCGSGTTGLACQKLGRDFIGIELDAYYCELAKKRLGIEEKHNDLE